MSSSSPTGRAVRCCVCSASDSLLWRRRDDGDVVCNACFKQNDGSGPKKGSYRGGGGSLERRHSKRTASVSDKTRSRQQLHQGRHTTSKTSKPFKSPSGRSTICSGEAVFHRGVRFKIGDVVSLLGTDGRVYYGQLRGFVQDQYGQKMGAITWLLPRSANPTHFDPEEFIIGPEEETLWSLDYVDFVMVAYSK